MILNNTKNTYLLLLLWMNFHIISCAQHPKKNIKVAEKKEIVLKIKTGADRTDLYLEKLQGKNIAIVANQTSLIQVVSTIKETTDKLMSHHLVDYLHQQKDVNVKKVFAPEHGFRGKVANGETIVDGIDTKTNLPIISLYGKNKKPTQKQLEGIDIVVFDIQDVGARFYTYISTLHYLMEACAEANIPIVLLDRPNPNGHYIDGPMLEKECKSFIGMHPVPVIYGMTIGEYGKMINGENWLENGLSCNYEVIPLENYTHSSKYSLAVRPSPNLPNDVAINLYPSLCFFEGTNISEGRGTEKQFQIYGAPHLKDSGFSFTPKPNVGSKYPKHENKVCYGEDLSTTPFLSEINLFWLLKTYKETNDKKSFFTSFFKTVAGTKKLQKQMEEGLSEEQIKESWQEDLNKFKKIREKYLIYQ